MVTQSKATKKTRNAIDAREHKQTTKTYTWFNNNENISNFSGKNEYQ